MAGTEREITGTDAEHEHVATSNGQGSNKKPLRKTSKVKPEEVSTPTHFEHLVHIEDLQSNANNFVVPKASHDPVIKSIFNVIDKNIVDAGCDDFPSESRKKSSSASSSLSSRVKLFVRNPESNSGSVATAAKFYVNGTEAYDNLNNLIIPTDLEQRQQPGLERNNLQLDLNSTELANGEKRPSLPSAVAPGFFEGRNSQDSSTESTLILPSRKKLGAVPSIDSSDTLSPVTPFTPAAIPLQNPDLKRQEAAYDAIISRNSMNKPMSPLYENQEVAAGMMMKNTTGTNNLESKRIAFRDEVEIQQALKQLDDVLDEQIPIEAFSTLNSKAARMESKKPSAEDSERKDKPVLPEGNKKSVKQLAQMLNSKPLHFGARNIPQKFHATDRDPESIVDEEDGGGVKANPDAAIPSSLSASEAYPEIKPKPSLIGVSIFGPGTGKSIAEIIAEKRNRKASVPGPRPPLPFSPKPILRKLDEIRRPDTMEEEEHDRSPSSSQVITSSDSPEKPSKTIFDTRKNAKKPIHVQSEVQGEQRRRLDPPAVPPTIVKVPDATSYMESAVPTHTDATSEMKQTATDVDAKDHNANLSQNVKQHVAVSSADHTYENLYPNDGTKLLETSFDSAVAKTVLQERTNNDGAAKKVEKSRIQEERKEISGPSSISAGTGSVQKDIASTHRKQQGQCKQPAGTTESKPSLPSAPPPDTADLAPDVKWRTDYVAPTDSQESTELEPIPPLRTRSKRGSYGRISGQRMVQRSTSLYTSDSNELSAGFSTETTADASSSASTGEYREALRRWSSMSTPDTAAHIQKEKPRPPLVPPKPAPRHVDYLKHPTTTNKVADVSEGGNVGKAAKRPVPIPRQSKLKAALNDDLLKKTSFTGTKTQHSTVNGLEPLITIAKTTNSTSEDDDDATEWTLRL